ncbi:MAG: protein translocase subunit SecD [Ignavibacteriaceae bacterium]|jgi:SecD/SecF fusion protein|nr:protein translocase subunit SecD [Ignavibacteriaceae bacterium]
MEKYLYRILITVAVLALSIYFLYPTYQDYLNSSDIKEKVSSQEQFLKKSYPNLSKDSLDILLLNFEDSLKSADESYAKTRAKRLKLGLDLQGGMRVVLEVNTAQLLQKLANDPDPVFVKMLDQATKEAEANDEPVVDIMVKKLTEANIRISRYFGNVDEDDAKIISNLKDQTVDAVTRAEQILRNRIDQYGVSEPVIQKQGNNRIVVELPGIANEEEARQLIQSTALLEFKMVRDPQYAINLIVKINNSLAGGKIEEDVKPATDTTKTTDSTATAKADEKTDSTTVAKADSGKKNDTAQAAKTDTAQKSPEQLAKENPILSLISPSEQTGEIYVPASNREKLQRLLNSPISQAILADNDEFLFSNHSFLTETGEKIYTLFCVTKNPELTGGVITEAVGTPDPSGAAGAVVSMTMNSEGSVEWARITGANIDKRCAIVLDGVVYSAPVIRNKITGGRSQIDGMKDLNEAKLLANILNAGAFAAPVEIIEERTVGPSLGEDSITAGLQSVMFGFLLVAMFMMVYYRGAGGIASFALVFVITMIIGTLAAFGATLTLPGIAGIVLTIGMAVDSNVLIYERIREEMALGKTMKASVEGGFAKAGSAIWDSNITTLITSIILYQFGTGPIQGFALTLMIGIITSLFGALVIAKVIFEYFTDKGHPVSLG